MTKLLFAVSLVMAVGAFVIVAHACGWACPKKSSCFDLENHCSDSCVSEPPTCIEKRVHQYDAWVCNANQGDKGTCYYHGDPYKCAIWCECHPAHVGGLWRCSVDCDEETLAPVWGRAVTCY